MWITYKNAKIKILAIIIAAVLAGGVAYYFTGNRPAAIPFFNSFTAGKNKESGETDNVEILQHQVYTNSKYGFSFNYPKDFSVSEFSDGADSANLPQTDVILVKDAAGKSAAQISVSPFDEPGPITKERILRDISDMPITGEKEISVGGEKALSFASRDASSGETLEIWFVHGGNLYQISAFINFGDKLEEIIKTWKFK